MQAFLDRKRIQRLRQAAPKGEVVRMYDSILGREFIAPNTYCGLLEVLNNKDDFPRPTSYRQMLIRFVGDGVLSAEGEQHKQFRRLLNPSFSTSSIRQQHGIIWSQASSFSQELQRHIEKGSHMINLSEWVGLVIRFLSRPICDVTKYYSLADLT